MELKKGLGIIIKDLKDAIEIIDDISVSHGVPLFQSELAKTKCRSAVELLTMLADSDMTAGFSPEKASVEKLTPSSPAESKADETIIFVTEAEVPEIEPVVESSSNIDIIHEPAPEPVQDETKEVKSTESEDASPAPKKKNASAGTDNEPEKAIVADRFGNGPARFSDKIPGIEPGKDLSSKIKSKPVTNINDAIGLNDKFFFIRELFGGNGQLFSEVVRGLNDTTSMNEAKTIIQASAAEGYNKDAMNLFIDIVARKLS